MRPKPLHSILFLLIATMLGGAACSSSNDDAKAELAASSATTETTATAQAATPSTTTAPPPSTTTSTSEITTPETFVERTSFDEISSVDWSPCGPLECATVEVPVDYRGDGEGTIALAVNKRAANNPTERIGYLLVNPGGPGETGLNFVEEAGNVYPSELLDRFDVIGFDPRGIGESEPNLSCATPEEGDAIFEGYNDEYGSADYIDRGERFLELCVEKSGPAFGLVHAEYVARDMDEIRKALGVEQISFHGLSWGAHIGLWYSTLFPEQTRAIVLDAALNPHVVGHTRVEMNGAYEGLLRQAIEACDETCPIYNDGDPVSYYYLEAAPKYGLVAEAMGDDQGDLFGALLGPVYDSSAYPALWDAIYELGENDNPEGFVELGSYSKDDSGDVDPAELAEIEANRWTNASANCVDELVLHPEVTQEYLLTDESSPDMPLIEAAARGLQANEPADDDETGAHYDLNFCAFLHPYAPEPYEGRLDGSDVPVIVVANAFEGPIPYGQSIAVATEVLSNGYLIDVLGSGGHVVGVSNQCAFEPVLAMFLDLTVPAERHTVCDAESGSEEQPPTREMIFGHCLEFVGEAIADAPRSLGDDEVADLCNTILNRAEAEGGTKAFLDDQLLERIASQIIEDKFNN